MVNSYWRSAFVNCTNEKGRRESEREKRGDHWNNSTWIVYWSCIALKKKYPDSTYCSIGCFFSSLYFCFRSLQPMWKTILIIRFALSLSLSLTSWFTFLPIICLLCAVAGGLGPWLIEWDNENKTLGVCAIDRIRNERTNDRMGMNGGKNVGNGKKTGALKAKDNNRTNK